MLALMMLFTHNSNMNIESYSKRLGKYGMDGKAACLSKPALFLVLMAVWVSMPSAASAGWSQPVSLETWDDLDGAVADRYASLTNEAYVYPPGPFRFSVPGTRFIFPPEGELSGITNFVAPIHLFGVPLWQINVVETVTVSRVWLYAGIGGCFFRTNDAPAALDPLQWVGDVYRQGPPPYLSEPERETWYADRARDRLGLDITMISSNDWPALQSAMVAAATNNPPPGSPPLVLPEDTNRIAFAAVQAVSNALNLSVYTPVDRLPVDLLTRPALGTATNAWLIRSTFFPAEPFDTWSGPYMGSTGFFLAARTDTDSDGDGISDCREIYVLGTRPDRWDSAGLAIGDFARMYVYGLAPLLRDTNGDGMDDDESILRGMNPVTQTNTVDSSTIRYLYDRDDRLTGTFTTTSGGTGGGAALYTVSPAHNVHAVSERSAP